MAAARSWLRCRTVHHWWMCCCALCDESSISGTGNFSSILDCRFNDHARSDQHTAFITMKLRTDQARARNESLTSLFRAIARSLLVMDEPVKDRLRKKFDICYVMAKEKTAFKIQEVSCTTYYYTVNSL